MAAFDQVLASCPTAFYTFDTRALRERVAYLRARLPENCSLCYAVKANPFVAGEIADAVDAFEICSPGEAAICGAAGIGSEKTVISGVYKTPSFIEGLIADPDFRGILTVESATQYRLFRDLAEKYGREIRALLRLTNDSQFGINEEEIDEMIASRGKTPLVRIAGIQFFSGTQKFSVKKIAREIASLDALLVRLESEYGFRSPCLEYGPGFPVSYFEGEEFDDWDDAKDIVKTIIERNYDLDPELENLAVDIVMDSVGSMRLDNERFQYFLKKFELQAEKCLFIDDNLQNVMAARHNGMKAICFKDASQLRALLLEN